MLGNPETGKLMLTTHKLHPFLEIHDILVAGPTMCAQRWFIVKGLDFSDRLVPSLCHVCFHWLVSLLPYPTFK